jgi:hypothetical protein
MTATTAKMLIGSYDHLIPQYYDPSTDTFVAANGTNGVAHVTASSLPADFHTQITPTIAGVATPIVAINSGAAAGSKHIEDSSPTLADALAEQIAWDFPSLDVVRQVEVSLNTLTPFVTALSGTAGAVVQAPEAQSLLVTVNPGDDVTAATRLRNGYPEVFEVLPGEKLTISSSVAITKVYALAKLSSVGTPLANSATASCKGASHA